MSEIIYTNKLKVGETNIIKEFVGETNVKKMYIGTDEVYRKLSFAPTLRLGTDELTFRASGTSAQAISVTSNTSWAASTNDAWITIASSDSGISVSVADYADEENDRTGTITITADNGDIAVSKTVSVLQKKATSYTPLSTIYSTVESRDFSFCIDTGVIATTGTSMRFNYVARSTANGNGNRFLGYSPSDLNTTGGTIDDGSDYRYFGYAGGTFDYNYSRISFSFGVTNGTEYDITAGNNYIYDNQNSTMIATGTTQSTQRATATIRVDVGSLKPKSLIIYEGETEVFHGVAAMDADGHIGLWDTVNDEFHYNSNLTMSYDE